ncbi:DDRGK domain containing 1 [Phyllostomus discolor]|uniref:DDRGK domain containing 1 n=1 Tax=Phyllostomus discolor TaxID=89673 RepID=A0A833Z0A4_9CHIR|nr:DDRGK domain containing 1 [Phyllostomus discolor]
MVAPVVVYLVAAALLVGLIFFLTRRRGPAAAASGEPLHNEEAAGRAAQPRPLEPEDQRAGGRPRHRRDLGSRLQAQRQAQRLARSEVDENEEEVIIPAHEEESEKPAETHPSGKIGAKKLRKPDACGADERKGGPAGAGRSYAVQAHRFIQHIT